MIGSAMASPAPAPSSAVYAAPALLRDGTSIRIRAIQPDDK
jgi:hypothetical protein